MIPANEHLNEFLPYIIKNLIEKNIDLSTEYAYLSFKTFSQVYVKSFNLLSPAGCQQLFCVLATSVILQIRYSLCSFQFILNHVYIFWDL